MQSPNLDLVNKFLDRVALEGGTKYAYQIGGEERLTMTAEALLCRQYLGWKHDDPRMRAGIDQLLANRIEYSDDPNVYYWYYATQACHHMGGDDWNRWNERLRDDVIRRARVSVSSESDLRAKVSAEHPLFEAVRLLANGSKHFELRRAHPPTGAHRGAFAIGFSKAFDVDYLFVDFNGTRHDVEHVLDGLLAYWETFFATYLR